MFARNWKSELSASNSRFFDLRHHIADIKFLYSFRLTLGILIQIRDTYLHIVKIFEDNLPRVDHIKCLDG